MCACRPLVAMGLTTQRNQTYMTWGSRSKDKRCSIALRLPSCRGPCHWIKKEVSTEDDLEGREDYVSKCKS